MAYTLQSALDIACGSREMFLHAEIMRSSITTTCRRLHLLRATKAADWSDPATSLEERWKTYIEDEGRRRLGWGIYVSHTTRSKLIVASRCTDGRITRSPLYDVDQRSHHAIARK